MKKKYIAMALTIMSLMILAPNEKAYASSYWTQKNGGWYYISDNSKIMTGWVQDNGKWYYLGADGKMRVGWIQDGSNWYYLYSDGSMAKNTTISGYYLGSNGARTTSGSSGAVNGISYTELIDRIDGMEFVGKTYITPAELGETYGAYGWYWKNPNCGSVFVYDVGAFCVQVGQNDTEFNRATLQIFNWLLPTQGNNLNNIICTNPKNQTLIMDGRIVIIELRENSIYVVISG